MSKRVDRDPTPAMIAAGMNVRADPRLHIQLPEDVWRAMYDVAPDVAPPPRDPPSALLSPRPPLDATASNDPTRGKITKR